MALDLSAAMALNDRLTSGGKVPYLKLGVGKHALRILPPPEGMPLPWMEYKRCTNVGPGNKFVVPPHQFDPSQPDPIGEEIARLEALGDTASLQRAKDMKPKTVFAMFVIERGHEGKGPQLWTATPKQVQDLLTFIANPEAGGDITDPETGVDLLVTISPDQSGKLFKGKPVNEWRFALKRNSSRIDNPAWLSENLFEKWKVGRPSDVEYIRACLAGTDQQWLDERKAQRAKERAETAEDTPAEGASPSLPKNDAAVRAKLEEIRQRTQKPKDSTRSDLGDFLG
jgi:hypothetical protein